MMFLPDWKLFKASLSKWGADRWIFPSYNGYIGCPSSWGLSLEAVKTLETACPTKNIMQHIAACYIMLLCGLFLIKDQKNYEKKTPIFSDFWMDPQIDQAI